MFYRPKNPLLSTVLVYFGGPSPSRRDDPAVRFDEGGVEHHQSYGNPATITRLSWPEVRAIAVLPGPTSRSSGLCVYPVAEVPVPGLPVAEPWSGTGAALAMQFQRLFGTPFAVYLHHSRGPAQSKLETGLRAWTAGRLTLTSVRPDDQPAP